MQKIINAHCHIYPEKIAEKAVESVGKFYNIEMDGQGTAEALLKNSNGISSFVVHSVAVSPKTVTAINDFISGECTKNDSFYGFGTMHADFKDKIEEMKR